MNSTKTSVYFGAAFDSAQSAVDSMNNSPIGRARPEAAAESIWTEVLERLRDKIRPNLFSTYLSGTSGLSFMLTKSQRGILTIGCSRQIQVDGINRHLKPEITAEVSGVVGTDTYCSIRQIVGRRIADATFNDLSKVTLDGLPRVISVTSEQLLEQALGSIVFSRRVPHLGPGQMESFNMFGQIHFRFRLPTGELMTEDARDIVLCGHTVELDGQALVKLGETHRDVPIVRATDRGALLVPLLRTADPVRFQWLLPPFASASNGVWTNREFSYFGSPKTRGQRIALEGYELPESWKYFDISDPGCETEIHVPASRRYSGPMQENWLE